MLVAESFVAPAQLRGTCDKAAGWHGLGPTGGFARDDRDFYLDLDAPKQRWVRPLHPQGLAWLAADALPPALAALIPAAAPRCAYQSAQRDPLWQRFQDRLTDPRARRGKRHLLASILAGQPRRAQARPETYHLPDCHRDGRFGLKAAVGWLALRYTPP